MTLLHPTRRFWSRRNELTRPTDRAELALRLGALLIALLLLPVALAIGSDTYVNRSRAADEQAHAVHPWTATVLSQPVGATTTSHLARWDLPDGTSRIGRVRIDANSASPGDRVPIWLDAHGNAADPPASQAGALVIGVGIAVFGWLLAVLLLLVLLRFARGALDRRRSAAWQRDWARVEPGWSGRSP